MAEPGLGTLRRRHCMALQLCSLGFLRKEDVLYRRRLFLLRLPEHLCRQCFRRRLFVRSRFSSLTQAPSSLLVEQTAIARMKATRHYWDQESCLLELGPRARSEPRIAHFRRTLLPDRRRWSYSKRLRLEESVCCALLGSRASPRESGCLEPAISHLIGPLQLNPRC